MKNIIRVTAIILTMVTVIVTHPFLSLEAKAFDRPIKMDRVLNNSSYPHASVSYTYFVDEAAYTVLMDHPLDSQPIQATEFILEVVISFDEICSCQFTLNWTRPDGPNNDTFVPEYIVYGGRVLTASNGATVVRVDNNQFVVVKYVLTYDSLYEHFNYWYYTNDRDPGYTYSNGQMWVEAGYDFFRISNFSYTNYSVTTDLDDLNNSILVVDQSIEDLQTFQLYDIPEYSWSIYYLFKRKWSLKYDNTFPRPYVTTTDDSSSNFSWDDAIQIQDRDLYIVLATFGASSSTLPVKIIKSNNTDVSSDFTWTYRYTGRYRFYYAKIPESLFNNALNIKWTAAVNVMPIYLGRLRNMPFEVAEICNIDSNNQIVRILNDLKTAINNINVTNNTTVNEINTNITEYNTTIQNVFNVENNLSTSLDQSMQLYTPDNTNVLQRLNDSSTLLKSVINQVNGIEIFTIPLAVALVGIVLIAIVG